MINRKILALFVSFGRWNVDLVDRILRTKASTCPAPEIKFKASEGGRDIEIRRVRFNQSTRLGWDGGRRKSVYSAYS